MTCTSEPTGKRGGITVKRKHIRNIVEKALGTDSPVKVGFILALLSLCAGGFSVWIWWAATISTKLDTVITQQAAMNALTSKMASDVEELKSWRRLIDASGSKQAQDITKEIEFLRRDLELHKAKTDGKP